MGAYTSCFPVRLLPIPHPVSLLRRCALELEKQNCHPARPLRTSCSRIRIPPTSALSQAIFRASPLLTELMVVREWLQETAPAACAPRGEHGGYWKFTKHTINQGVRTGHAPREGLVSDMDPDAVNRVDGAGLAAGRCGKPSCADSPAVLLTRYQSYEKSLLQALYGYIRAGRIEDAEEVCRRAHQPWRAASIRGYKFFKWNALCESHFHIDATPLTPYLY